MNARDVDDRNPGRNESGSEIAIEMRLHVFIRLLVVAILVGALSAAARAETFYQGLQAYNVGDYGRAADIWGPLAAGNDGNAQSGLGLLYYKGLGVGQDWRQALKWFGLAANNGVVQAQMFLSLMLWHGHGVPRSPVWAYMWCDLVVTAGLEGAIEWRHQIEATLSDHEIAEARRLVARWHEAHNPMR